MKKYIDCDGVILDTETGLFDQYYIQKQTNPELKKRLYLQELDWVSWIHQAEILNDAIKILKNYNPSETDILTKVHSMQEAFAKVEYFREKQVKNNIIIVPDNLPKSKIVSAQNNILVDDSNNNLTDWENQEGIAIYGGMKDSNYPIISNLEEVLNANKLQKVLLKSRKK